MAEILRTQKVHLHGVYACPGKLLPHLRSLYYKMPGTGTCWGELYLLCMKVSPCIFNC